VDSNDAATTPNDTNVATTVEDGATSASQRQQVQGQHQPPPIRERRS